MADSLGLPWDDSSRVWEVVTWWATEHKPKSLYKLGSRHKIVLWVLFGTGHRLSGAEQEIQKYKIECQNKI